MYFLYVFSGFCAKCKRDHFAVLYAGCGFQLWYLTYGTKDVLERECKYLDRKLKVIVWSVLFNLTMIIYSTVVITCIGSQGIYYTQLNPSIVKASLESKHHCRLMCYVCRMNVVTSTRAGQVIFITCS